ncbi:MAG: hypothetical protein ACXWFZ_12655, partial [Nitrososphaeraceae archaeon]
DKDIKIETDEDVGLDDKIKAGARALGKKIEDPDRDTGSEYEAEKPKKEWLIDGIDSIINKSSSSSCSNSNIHCNNFLPSPLQ